MTYGSPYYDVTSLIFYKWLEFSTYDFVMGPNTRKTIIKS